MGVATMKDSTYHPNDKQSVVKPEKPEELQQANSDHDALTPNSPQLMPKMPKKGAGNFRRSAALQMDNVRADRADNAKQEHKSQRKVSAHGQFPFLALAGGSMKTKARPISRFGFLIS